MTALGCVILLTAGVSPEALSNYKAVPVDSALAAEATDSAARAERPNILLISVDDLNNWVGYAGGNASSRTPNIDSLAERGVAFTQTFSQFPLCGPSRASLFSGLLPGTLGLLHQPKPDSVVVEAAQRHGTLLLHSYFQRHGYKTMAVGKLLHRHVPDGSVDLSGGRGNWNRLPGDERIHFDSDNTMTDWGVYPLPESEMSDPASAEWAAQQLQQKHDRPFLLMVGFLRPHVPWYVPQKYFDAIGDPATLALPPYRPDYLVDVPEYARKINIADGYPRTDWAIETGQWPNIVHAYLASTYFADHYVGQVLKALEKSPYADNTIVVLFSDHGYHVGEKGSIQKQSLWERANKVPLIFSGPGIPRGETRTQPVGLIDIYPTLLDLAGLPPNQANEGHSAQQLLMNASAEWGHPVITQWRRSLNDGTELRGQAVQSGPWRYSLYGDGSEELYNHLDDPNEWTNLAAATNAGEQFRKLMDELKAQLPVDFFQQALDKR
ncbi:sulfatase [Elongatibacter sediminis]|uniref:Sulfatase n=1 Tax=Elongatibacter sediminis TaxID=3119006 RepID=A0AAW9RIF2_9GAMM